MTIPWLTLLIAVPLVGAIVTAFLPRTTLPRYVALAVSVLTLVGAGIVAAGYDAGGGMQFTEEVEWISVFGAHYALGVDGLGLLMILLTAVLVPIVLLASSRHVDEVGVLDAPRAAAFSAWVLALEALSIAVFAATDVFLFYVVFEATLIPAYFLIGGFGRRGRSRAAVKFLIYQLAGGLIMLASVIGLYVVSARAGAPSYLISDLAALDIGETTQRWLFAGFFVAFAIKAPLFPVHTWLADTIYMVNHGLATALLFLVAGFLIRRTGTPLMSRMHGGIEKVAPVLAGTFLIAGLATCGLPGLSPFVSEILVLISAFDYAWWAGAVAVTAIVLAAIYALWMYQRTMTGPPGPGLAGYTDLDRREVGAVAPLVLALVLFGFYPMPMLDVINPTVDTTLQQAGVSDDGPTVTPAGASAEEGDH
jgi:NADH:ubiquinone oxidoreductase subunit 4 (subunit M)